MIDFHSGRQRAANYIMICSNIVDSYPDGIAHGLQKDAIQNATDARRGKRTVNVVFELVSTRQGHFLTITDTNTTGLTGPVLYGLDDYEKELPTSFHWARFESFAFTKDDPNAIGARGQGKFIFLGASEKCTMYYDTLREDGVYRLGGTRATRTGCPILPPENVPPWEGAEGTRELFERTGLNPLKEIGTRIIIVEPVDEIREALSNGLLLQGIEETWFRSLEKKLISVSIKVRNSIAVAMPPFPYPLPARDATDAKVWVLGHDFHERDIQVGNLTYRVKNFHAARVSEELPEHMRGISIIHNGMKVTSLDMTIAPAAVNSRIAGYVEFDIELDQELRKGENQHPNHYDLKWRRKLPFAIKGYVAKQLEAFGINKLGLGTDPRELRRSRRTNAEDWALRQLMKHATGLDLFGAKGHTTRRPTPPPPPPPLKPIGVSIHNFNYPLPEIAPRVNWGSVFSGITVGAQNRTDEGRDVSLLVQVLLADTTVYQPLQRLSGHLTRERMLQSSEFDIAVEKAVFDQPGEYRLTATLFDSKSGDKIDSVARRFWVEKDPPLRQPFDIQALAEFPAEMKYRQWFATGSINSSPTLYYNMAHPAYRTAEDDEELQRAHIFEMVLAGAIQFVLNRPDCEDGRADYHPLDADAILGNVEGRARQRGTDEEIPSRAFGEIERYASEIRWRVYEGA